MELVAKLGVFGKFKVEHFDAEGKLLDHWDVEYFPNGITNEGRDAILDVFFNDGVAIANNSWFCGLIDSSGYTALANADTIASHAGWNEFTSYNEATRVALGTSSASGQVVTTPTPMTFNITGSGTLKGGFVISNNTKGGVTGTLWCTSLFPTAVPVSNGDQLKVTYAAGA